MGSMVRATNLWGYDELVRELGGDPDDFLTRFQIPADIAHHEDAFISVESFVRMLETSATDLGCSDFGLRLSRWQGLDILGPVAVIARNAQTLLDGLAAIARYLYVHSPALTLTTLPHSAGTDLTFVLELTEPALPYAPQAYELSLANGVRMIRLLGGPDAVPSTVSFAHGQLGSEAQYRETFICPVLFEQSSCGFALPEVLANRLIDNADPETRRIAARYLESRYIPRTTSLSERVAELARRLLPTGRCTSEEIAEHLAMHRRTLQRRLADEGVSCHEIIERQRRDQAVKYLAEPGLHLSQIAGLLGYSEQSTFNRSCRRWFDRTPRQYRLDLTAISRPLEVD